MQNIAGFPALFLVVAALGALLLSWVVNRSAYLLVVLGLVTITTGMLRMSIVQMDHNQVEHRLKPFDQSSVELEGEVKSIHQSKKGFRYILQNPTISTTRLTRREKILVQLFSDEEERLSVGTKVRTTGEFRLLEGPRNPGEFDFRSFFHRQNVWASVYQDVNVQLHAIEKRETFRFGLWIDRLRESVKNLFSKTIRGDAGSLMSAITVGLRADIPTEIRQDFRDTGIIHILAVSGLHVGFVLVIFLSLAKLSRLPYPWDKIAVIAALIMYAVLSGGRPSVWRATVMASVFVVGAVFQRRANYFNIIATSALVLLIYKPGYLFDAGFLLSFAAVVSIVFFYNQFDMILPERLRVSKIQNRISRGIAALFLVSLAAQIGTLPFIWSYFNRVPIVALAANVITVPIVGLLVPTGFSIMILGSWIPHIGEILGNTSWLLGETVFGLADFFSRLPFAYVEIGRPSWINLVQYGAIVGSLVLLLRKDYRRKGVLVLLFTLNLFVWPWALHRPVLDVIFLDVGQGDSAVIRIPGQTGNKTILVDAGMKSFYGDKGESVVVPAMKHLGIDEIDLFVMTHPHSDHIGGTEAVLAEFPTLQVWDTFAVYRSNLYDHSVEVISNKSIPFSRVGSGRWVADFTPAHLYTLHPDSAYATRSDNVNNVSVAMKLVYGRTSFLFVGDVEKEGDREIVEYGDLIRSDVLKVGHHGSATSTSQEFLHLVKPDYAVVSVGEKNRFNHPSEEVIFRLENSGARVFRTDLDRAIWFKSDGERVWVHNWR